jgi:hypothetical protein
VTPIRLAATAAALAFTAPATAQVAPAPAPPLVSAPDYSSDSAWLCLPGREDACSRPLATTALNANGYGSVGQARPAADAPADCFYVYPTVSRDPGLNSDLAPGLEENATAMVQLARFAGVCRPFAPIYRQLTASALPRSLAGEDMTAAFDIAYADVLAAWRDFLARRNSTRPFVLIGHSQGSIHLVRLLASEIEGKPEADRMLSAILTGWAVEVPEGKTVGGSFQKTPLCTRTGQTGCVITFMSFRATNPPPPESLLGRALRPGMTAACTNPAGLGRGTKPLDSYWFTAAPTRPGIEPVVWSSEGAPPTPFLRSDGLVSASCVNRGAVGYLSVTVNADPGDVRTDRIPGDVYLGETPLPGWGLHLVDMNLAQGDLIALVEAQSRAFRSRR